MFSWLLYSTFIMFMAIIMLILDSSFIYHGYFMFVHFSVNMVNSGICAILGLSIINRENSLDAHVIHVIIMVFVWTDEQSIECFLHQTYINAVLITMLILAWLILQELFSARYSQRYNHLPFKTWPCWLYNHHDHWAFLLLHVLRYSCFVNTISIKHYHTTLNMVKSNFDCEQSLATTF